jgi:hypothetical protein
LSFPEPHQHLSPEFRQASITESPDAASGTDQFTSNLKLGINCEVKKVFFFVENIFVSRQISSLWPTNRRRSSFSGAALSPLWSMEL